MQEFLKNNAQLMGVNLSDKQLDLLLQYTDLIEKWNKTYNLTAIKGKQNILIHHILDSLSILKFLGDKQQILDIGTGAGLPAVVIAIMTNNKVVAVDKVAKKTRFLQFVKAELKLNNLTIINDKVENLKTTFDIITSRAFADIAKTIDLSQHLLTKSGKYLLMKGNNWQQENLNSVKIFPYQVSIPNLSENRFILEINL
jgi:16S rRNA (guanine527-N7)-methyltransferase